MMTSADVTATARDAARWRLSHSQPLHDDDAGRLLATGRLPATGSTAAAAPRAPHGRLARIIDPLKLRAGRRPNSSSGDLRPPPPPTLVVTSSSPEEEEAAMTSSQRAGSRSAARARTRLSLSSAQMQGSL